MEQTHAAPTDSWSRKSRCQSLKVSPWVKWPPFSLTQLTASDWPFGVRWPREVYGVCQGLQTVSVWKWRNADIHWRPSHPCHRNTIFLFCAATKKKKFACEFSWHNTGQFGCVFFFECSTLTVLVQCTYLHWTFASKWKHRESHFTVPYQRHIPPIRLIRDSAFQLLQMSNSCSHNTGT